MSTQQWHQFDCRTAYCLLKLHSTLHSMLSDMPKSNQTKENERFADYNPRILLLVRIALKVQYSQLHTVFTCQIVIIMSNLHLKGYASLKNT